MCFSAHLSPLFGSGILVINMTGAAIAIDDASATDTIRSIKERVHAANRELPVRRQRLVYRPGPRGMEALADDETLGGAGVAQDGTAELDVLVEPLTDEEADALGKEVWWLVAHLVSAYRGRRCYIEFNCMRWNFPLFETFAHACIFYEV